MLACRIGGHRPRNTVAGTTLRWQCVRGCGAAGAKDYAKRAEPERYAGAFNREDSAAFGRRLLLSMLPIRLIERTIRCR